MQCRINIQTPPNKPIPCHFPRSSIPPPTRHSAIPPTLNALNPTAFNMFWDSCTIRGSSDGSIIFKFDQRDPLEDWEKQSLHSSYNSSRTDDGDATTTSSSPSSSSTNASSSSAATATATFTWSNTIKLGTKYSTQIETSLSKLSQLADQAGNRQPLFKPRLDYKMWRPYHKALEKKYRAMYGRGIIGDFGGGDVESDGEEDDSSSSSGEEEVTTGHQLALHGVLNVESKDVPYDNNNNISGDTEVEGEQEQTHDDKETDLATAVAAVVSDALPMSYNYVIEKLQTIEESYIATANAQHASSLNDSHYTKQQQGAAEVATFLVTSISRLFSPLIATLTALLKSITFFLHNISKLKMHFSTTKMSSSSWPPPPPPIHASPRMAALLSNPYSINRGMLESHGFDSAGCAVLPLSDLSQHIIQSLVGSPINRPVLYRKALTHVSAVPQNKRVEASYERLEYLGDAVLELATRSLVMQQFPGANEGKLNLMVQNLVNGNQTAKYANFLNLEKYMALNVYEMRDGRQSLPSSQGDVFEAIIGALFLDQGFSAASDFILRIFNTTNVWSSDVGALPPDYKSQLIRITARGSDNNNLI